MWTLLEFHRALTDYEDWLREAWLETLVEVMG